MPPKKITTRELARIIKRATGNKKFRESLLKAPAETLKAEGFAADKDAVGVIKSLGHKSFGRPPRRRKPKDAGTGFAEAGN